MDRFELRALGLSREWEPDEVKWRLLIEAGQGSGVEDLVDGLVGTVTATPYREALQALG